MAKAKPENNTAISTVAELALQPGVSIAELATAIERFGYYTEDDYGRVHFINPQTKDNKDIKYRRLLLSELGEGFKAGEYDGDYYLGAVSSYCLLNISGWPQNDMPKFGELYKEWIAKNAKGQDVVLKPPAQQSHFYQIFLAALYKLESKETIEEIGSHKVKSDKTSKLYKKLELEEKNVSVDRMREHIRRALDSVIKL